MLLYFLFFISILLILLECPSLTKLHFWNFALNLDTNHPTTLNLANLDALESLTVGDFCCTSVNWLHLDFHSLKKCIIGEDSFTYCSHVWFDSLPVLEELQTGCNSFGSAALTVNCMEIDLI